MNWDQFNRWFNRDFWKAFRSKALPIDLPPQEERQAKVREVFEAVRSANYSPSVPEAEIVLNKGFGVARTVPVFCIEDYIVYYFCIKELEGVISGNRTENTFGGWSLGGAIRKQEQEDLSGDTGFYASRYSFNPRAWQRAFGEFNALLFSQLETEAYSHVLQFDLTNFYDCIRLDILERWIREDSSADQSWIVALLFYFLNQWNRRNTGLHPQRVGIPQDALADCSRLIANYYLQRYDKFAARICATVEASYFRYADDQMLLLKGTEHVEELMLLLTRQLDKSGLRVNQKKVHLWTAEELQRHRFRDIQAIFSEPGDNKDPVLVRRFVNQYLLLPAGELENSWNQGMPLLNRLVWANIESLPKRLFEKIIVQLTSKKYLMLADKNKLERIDELNALRRKPIDLARRLIRLGGRNCHNSFHYEVLAFAQASNDDRLIEYFSSRLQQLQGLMESNLVAAG